MKILYSIFFSCLLISCGKTKHLPAFNAFDFSFDDVFSTSFSIKFTQGDTVFIRQHFTYADSGVLKRNTTYYSILNNEEKNSIDSIFEKIHFLYYLDIYYEMYEDGSQYQFYVDKDSLKKTIYIHSLKAPPELDSLAYRIANFKAKLTLVPIDTIIEFGSLKHFLPPSPPPPPIENEHSKKRQHKRN